MHKLRDQRHAYLWISVLPSLMLPVLSVPLWKWHTGASPSYLSPERACGHHHTGWVRAGAHRRAGGNKVPAVWVPRCWMTFLPGKRPTFLAPVCRDQKALHRQDISFLPCPPVRLRFCCRVIGNHSQGVPACWGCCDTLRQAEWLINNLLLTALRLEAQDQVAGGSGVWGQTLDQLAS